jgi:lipoate-protein ligase A
MRQWRLIYDQPTLGSWNMAADDAILTAVAAGDVLPTLRLYGWSPSCLSLGYGQHIREADRDRLAANGWGIVRRPTGGRAILHADELTFSVALPLSDPLAAGDVIESYHRISAALVAAVVRLGAPATAEPAAKESQQAISSVCFETPSHYEIMAERRKLVGSAQMRRRQGILQHGTLPLFGDITRICDVLVYPDENARHQARNQVRARATTLADVLGVVIDWQTAARAIADGFAETFDLGFTLDELTPAERAHTERLTNEVYGAESWTSRR